MTFLMLFPSSLSSTILFARNSSKLPDKKKVFI